MLFFVFEVTRTVGNTYQTNERAETVQYDLAANAQY
jgi:hypothetical protein